MSFGGISLVDLAPATLVGATVIMLLLGWIVPRSTLKDKIEECKTWREAYEAERKAREVTDSQTVELLEVTKTTQALINAVFRNSEHIRKSGEVDVAPKD